MSKRDITYVMPGTGTAFEAHYRSALTSAASADTTVNVTGVDMPADQRASPLLPDLPFYYGRMFRTLKALDDQGASGAIIGCSVDPGLEEAKDFCRMPVVGPLESALTVAQLHRWRIGMIVPGTMHEYRQYQDLARRYGLADVVAAIEVVDLDYPPLSEMSTWSQSDPSRLSEEVLGCHATFIDDRLPGVTERILDRSDTQAIYLGCTLWTGMAAHAEELIDLPVIDPGLSALWLVEALASRHPMFPSDREISI